MVAGGTAVPTHSPKDPTFLAVVSAIFLGVLALVFAVLKDPPTYVVVILMLAMIVSGLLFIYAIFDYFSKPDLKPIPIAIKNGQIVIEGYSYSEVLPVLWIISHDFGNDFKMGVEFKHQYSKDGINFENSNSVFTEVNASGSGEQNTEVFKIVRENKANFGMTRVFDKIILSLAGNKIISNQWQRPYHIIDVIFSHTGFKPVRKRVWIERRGYCYYSKPESWPDETQNDT